MHAYIQIWTKFYMMKDNQLVFMLVNGGKNVVEDGKAVKALQHSQGPNMPVCSAIIFVISVVVVALIHIYSLNIRTFQITRRRLI